MSYCISDIITDLTKQFKKSPEWEADENSRLNPNSIAEVGSSIAHLLFLCELMRFHQSYLYLVNQDRSAWTWELDCKRYIILC